MNPSKIALSFSRRGIGALALVFAAVVVFGPNRHSGAAEANALRATAGVPVTMAPAETRDVDVALRGLGTVTPVSTVTITSRVAGVLQEVDYQEGQMVKKSDLLAVIDPGPYAAALEQAQGQLAHDEAQLANARLDLERYRTAIADHAIPEQQAATQGAVVQADEGTVKLDRGSVAAAQVNLDYTRILSPIDGRVGLRLVDAGNNVAANGTTGLVTVTQLQPITVVFTLAQDSLPQVLAGLRRGAPMRVEAFDRTRAKPVAAGVLLTVDNQVDPATGTFRLKATFANENTALWPGSFVSLRLIVGVRSHATTVPERAVQRGPDGSYVFVIKPDLTVELRNVVATPTDEGICVIERGVAPGEHIVVDGQYRLEPGTKVAVEAAAGSDRS
jgi:membrane fusion protein, multidrug efflux system